MSETTRKERYKCTAETPWTPDKGTFVQHEGAREVGGCMDGCCADYQCPHCGHKWREELPQ